MKKIITSLTIVAIISLFTITSFAQQSKTAVPKWVSEKGYWVVENNINDPFHHIIRFYNNDDVLIYKETLSGVRLNTDKKKVKMKLKSVLETSAMAWDLKRVPEEEKQYVSAILK
jgi:hypothetical protein